MEEEKFLFDGPVLVTGATGYVASWIVKYLLESGNVVKATVRNKEDESKYVHLLKIAADTPGTIEIFEADLLSPDSFDKAMTDCKYVFHTASPFKVGKLKDAQKELIDPALEGTTNVLESANKSSKVKRVVVTSSLVAIYGDNVDIENTGNGVFTEKHWNITSSPYHQPYSYSKTVAEKEAWKIAETQDQWSLCTINPGFVFGPSLTKRIDSTSIDLMLSMINGKFKSGVPDLHFGVADVRDVAMAHIRAAYFPKASGRHIAMSGHLSMIEIARIIKEQIPKKLPVPNAVLPQFLMYLFGPLQGFSWKYVNRNIGIKLKFDNSYTCNDLKMSFRNPSQTIVDHVNQLLKDKLA